MKTFFSEKLSSMTFTFSFIILLNAVVGFFQGIELENANEFILVLAFLILIMWGLADVISNFPFRSTRSHHLFNLGSQLITFFVIVGWIGLFPLTVEGIVTNGIIYVGLYFLNVRMRQQRINQLADAINEQLAKRDNS